MPPLSLWSRHFARRGIGLSLNKAMLQWPGDHQVADSTWGHFVWGSFVEDLWTAQQWRRLTSSLEDPFEERCECDSSSSRAPGSSLESRRAAYLQLLRTWTPRLSPRVEAWSSGLSHFIWRQGEGGETFCFVTVKRTGDA